MTRPRLIVTIGICAVLLLGLLAYVAIAGQKPPIGGAFTLIDTTGKTVTEKDFRDKYLLLYFGYTYCPDICPTTMATITDALAALGEQAAQTQPVFVTIDPERDTPPVLADYIARFSPRWQALTGTEAQLAAVEKSYHVYAAKHSTGPGPGDYLMDHSSIVYLMGPDGKFRALIDTEQPIEDVTANVRRQLAAPPK
jgi:protein SCO1/2